MTVIQPFAEGPQAVLRLTPWDCKSFGFATSEITSISYRQASEIALLLGEVDRWNMANDVAQCVTRIDAADNAMKAAIQECGFYFAETSLRLSKPNLARCELNSITTKRLCLRPAESRDRTAVQEIAATAFRFGRFQEDPYLEKGLAKTRHANWVGDLLDQGLLYVAVLKDQIVGFHAERLSGNGKDADLILTGTAGRYSMLSLPLWVSVLDSLQARGITRACTMISAANIGVLNLYCALDFHFDQTLLGFHKRYL
jgi:hypothetical protein